MRLSLIPRTVLDSVEPSIRSLSDRLFVLTAGRQGSKKAQIDISSFFETGIVVALFEFLLMTPALAHLEIRHENPYRATTKPEQVDLWIRAPTGGRAVVIEAGDFSPGKVKNDAKKMRRLNRNGTNWFLALFRDYHAAAPWARINSCRRRKGSLKGCHLGLDEKFVRSIVIRLPGRDPIHFGYALIRVE